MFINFNGDIVAAASPLVGAENRGLRYGDGVFETMRVIRGRLLLAEYHLERLYNSLSLLQFDLPGSFTPDFLVAQILAICEKNGISKAARVRLSLFRGDGGLYETGNNQPLYLIESRPISTQVNQDPIRLGIFPDARKAVDRFSGVKSNNFLIYAMAAKFAITHDFDDCLILNSQEMVCESTIANLFCFADGKLYTPPLSQGCVAGVMRRWLLSQLETLNYPVVEQPISVGFLQGSQEIFLTNAVQGIRPVGFLNGRPLGEANTQLLQQHLPDIV
jgi:branched-chain amino acid aminotransferase